MVTGQVCLKINTFTRRLDIVGYGTQKRYIFPYSTRACLITCYYYIVLQEGPLFSHVTSTPQAARTLPKPPPVRFRNSVYPDSKLPPLKPHALVGECISDTDKDSLSLLGNQQVLLFSHNKRCNLDLSFCQNKNKLFGMSFNFWL